LLLCVVFGGGGGPGGKTTHQALTRVGVSLCQAKGKKRMKAFGSVNVPQEAFMAVLNLKQDD